MENSFLIQKAKTYALKCHNGTNHTYDNKPYEVHLQNVVDYVIKYSHLVPSHSLEIVIATAWLHDVIEDCRETYNDVKSEVGVEIAEIVYALTNEKGKTRKERANSKYYEGIRLTQHARFIKICDRLANISYSINSGNRMLNGYRKEYNEFYNELYTTDYNEMWVELSKLLEE